MSSRNIKKKPENQPVNCPQTVPGTPNGQVSPIGNGQAVGFLEVAGYSVALLAMDKACKSADVQIVGIDSINPKDSSAFIPVTIQIKFTGKISDVKIAIQVAREEARKYNSEDQITAESIDQPYTGLERLIKISKVKNI